jgi:hypothetical protein
MKLFWLQFQDNETFVFPHLVLSSVGCDFTNIKLCSISPKAWKLIFWNLFQQHDLLHVVFYFMVNPHPNCTIFHFSVLFYATRMQSFYIKTLEKCLHLNGWHKPQHCTMSGVFVNDNQNTLISRTSHEMNSSQAVSKFKRFATKSYN